MGFLVRDTCLVEAEVTVLAVVNALSWVCCTKSCVNLNCIFIKEILWLMKDRVAGTMCINLFIGCLKYQFMVYYIISYFLSYISLTNLLVGNLPAQEEEEKETNVRGKLVLSHLKPNFPSFSSWFGENSLFTKCGPEEKNVFSSIFHPTKCTHYHFLSHFFPHFPSFLFSLQPNRF